MRKLNIDIKNEFLDAIDKICVIKCGKSMTLIKESYKQFCEGNNLSIIPLNYFSEIIIDLRKANSPTMVAEEEFYKNIEIAIKKIKSISNMINKYLDIEKSIIVNGKR